MCPQKKGKIAPEIYDHFTEHIGGVICDGIWVGRDSGIPNVKGFRMENITNKNRHIICAHSMQDKLKLVIDEWGCWHPAGSGPSKGANLFEQQSTVRDAMVSARIRNIFNNHCEKIKMTNVAQLVNNLHVLFLFGEEDCITTPTYHVFDMYKEHQGG